MNKEIILQNIEAIWSTFEELGDETEKEIASQLFFVLVALKQYWFDLNIKTVQIKYPKEDQDEIETFLAGINEF